MPGNHERSRIPLHLWATHPNIFIFDRPRTFRCQIGPFAVALSGFPFVRDVRSCFAHLLEQTEHRRTDADVSLLCLHQAVEGARVGPADFTFRNSSDVIRGRDIPGGFSAVLSGHIHRAQMLRRDLGGNPLAAPIIYPGSVERTSWAKKHEDKKYVVLEIDLEGADLGKLTDLEFISLPARPMVDVVLSSMAGPETLHCWPTFEATFQCWIRTR